MFKIGDKVKYVSKTNFNKWLYNRTGIIVEINKSNSIIQVKYKEEYKNKFRNIWWFKNTELKHVIPEYIRIWDNKLNEI